jgi:hypothetical protein
VPFTAEMTASVVDEIEDLARRLRLELGMAD